MSDEGWKFLGLNSHGVGNGERRLMVARPSGSVVEVPLSDDDLASMAEMAVKELRRRLGGVGGA